MKRPGIILRMLLPVLCLLPACGGPESLVHLDVSLTEAEVSSEAGSVFVRVACEGSWTLELQPSVDWATLSVSSGSGNRNSIILDYKSNKEESARTLTVVATAAGGKVSATATLTQRGYSPTVPSIGGGSGAAYTTLPWLELPATSETDGYDFFCRDCTVDGTRMRNYAYYWDYTNRVSHWVAYPLCSAYLGNSGRSEAWGYDPLLPAAKQQNVSGGYREGDNGWYARGHQLPSADRTVNDIINATTFYGTNITPQDNDFNGGVWATLESRVRAWANSSDTLYVVTGCVTDGATHYVYDRSNNKVTVPTAYYKAVLRYRKDATIGYKGYMAAAFWYNHEGYPKTFTKNESLSVAALEEKLGYELFVNLSDVVGPAAASSIKSEKPSTVKWWWQ